jgi:hypothetical protein
VLGLTRMSLCSFPRPAIAAPTIPSVTTAGTLLTCPGSSDQS